jgi:hypothetical protein
MRKRMILLSLEQLHCPSIQGGSGSFGWCEAVFSVLAQA